jgi:hypothetical protein
MPPAHKWFTYYWLACKRFGAECYHTWRWELLASMLVSLSIYFLSIRENRAAWKDFRTALLATALTLGAFALWHLVRIPWLIHRRVIRREEVGEHWFFGVLGVTVMAALLFGGYSLASSLLQMRALPVTIKIPAPTGPQVTMENPKSKEKAATHKRDNPNAGSITQGPGSIAQVGGQGNQATINNFGARLPRLVKVSEIGRTNPDDSYTTECVLRIESDVAPGKLTFQVKAQDLQEVTFAPNVGIAGIGLNNVMQASDFYRATVFGPSGEYLLSVKAKQKTHIDVGASFN